MKSTLCFKLELPIENFAIFIVLINYSTTHFILYNGNLFEQKTTETFKEIYESNFRSAR